MLNINTNLSSLIAQNSLNQSTNKLNTAIERMSTGCKINHAKDNAANYSISTNMTTKIGAYQVAEDNALQGLDMINSASESLTLIEDKLMRLRALAEQASNGTYGEQSMSAIREEAKVLSKEIERIYNTTSFNGIKLFENQRDPATTSAKPVLTEDGFLLDITRRDTSAMTTLESVDSTQALSSGTYSISTAEELVKLAEMTNAGLVGTSVEFVLANDIDLSSVSNWTPIGETYYDSGFVGNAFKGSFDGNGYVISNLRIDSTGSYIGLFGRTVGTVTIKNLGVESADVTGGEQVGILAGYCEQTTIQNCWTKGNVNAIAYSAGGLVGNVQGSSNIKNCYSETSVSSGDCAGGLVGSFLATITDSYFKGSVYSMWEKGSGGIAGAIYGNAKISGCYVDAWSNDGIGNFAGYIMSSNKLTIENSSFVANCSDKLYFGKSSSSTFVESGVNIIDSKILETNLQVGCNSDEASSIAISTGFTLAGVDAFSSIIDSENFHKYYLKNIDKILLKVSEKQTEYGAVQNRLESVVEEIGIQYDNLVSSRSTLRDADIAEVSAEYIQQQILQQASATLLATANQSPSVALQLI